MIIFRYLTREVLFTLFAVSSVLLLIIMSGRFVKYLADAAAGRLSADVLFAIMGYRLPGFLELILPLGLFLSILLAYGRLYTESEMTVLTACGMSRRRLVGYTLVPGVLISLLVGCLSLYISPMGIEKSESIFLEQKKRSEFDSLSPSRFQTMQGGSGITYAENLSSDRQRLEQVFMAEMADQRQNNLIGDEIQGPAVLVAARGEQVIDPESQQRYLLLQDGHRYEGRPGKADYRVTRFGGYAQLLTYDERLDRRRLRADAKSTRQLLESNQRQDLVALQWRISLPILVLVVTLLAVPLSYTNPRQGRYARMIPAILLYIIYLVSLNAARGAVEDGKIPVQLGLWWVHLIFLFIASVLLGQRRLRRLFVRPRGNKDNGGDDRGGEEYA